MLLTEVSVLIVDDVGAVRTFLKGLCQEIGFQKIAMASHGEEAKLVMDVAKPQLILCDWHMSPVDGMEFLKHVRSHPDHKNSVFVMVTAENAKENVVQAVGAGIDSYVMKPLTPKAIQTNVLGILVKKKVIG